MTTVRAAAPGSVPFTPVLDYAAKPGQLRPYVKEDSPDAALLRSMLASAGVPTDGRPLADAVRDFQTRYNAGAGTPIGVDGKAGAETLGALRSQLAGLGGQDLAITGADRDRFSAFMGRSFDYQGAQSRELPRDAISGAELAAVGGRGNEAAMRQLLDARLATRPDTTGTGEGELNGAATGEVVRRGVNALGAGKPVRFDVQAGTSLEEGLAAARRSGRSQQMDINGARVVVSPTDTHAAASKRYDAARAQPALAFEPPPGRDAFAAAAAEADRTGRAQTWKHSGGQQVTVRPGDTAAEAFARFNAESSRARLAKGIEEKAAFRRDDVFRDTVNKSLREQGVPAELKKGETLAQLEARVADRGAIKRAVGEADRAVAAYDPPRAKVASSPAATKKAVEAAAEGSSTLGKLTAAAGDVASTGARVLGKVAVPLGLAVDALDIGSAVERDAQRADGKRSETTKAVGRAAGGWGGAAAGAAAGAALGSVVPVVGTAVGALVGGVLGGFGGSQAGEAVAESINK